MSLSNDLTPKQIVEALTKLLKTGAPQLFAEHLSALDISSTDNINIVAEKIKQWCETRPKIERNLSNKIYHMGAGGTDGDAPEEIVREFMEVLNDNIIRLGLSRPSVPVVETDDSGTESVENPT